MMRANDSVVNEFVRTLREIREGMRYIAVK